MYNIIMCMRIFQQWLHLRYGFTILCSVVYIASVLIFKVHCDTLRVLHRMLDITQGFISLWRSEDSSKWQLSTELSQMQGATSHNFIAWAMCHNNHSIKRNWDFAISSNFLYNCKHGLSKGRCFCNGGSFCKFLSLLVVRAWPMRWVIVDKLYY